MHNKFNIFMISTENILTVAKKEIKSYFDNPTAYIVLVVFLLLWEWLFFRNAFVIGEASLRGLYELFPWLALLLVPALTMGVFAQEKSEGTLELLLTHPLRDGEVLLGKFLASVGMVAIALAFTFPLAASFAQYGNVDWGVVVGQYLAGIAFAGVLASLGVFVSSLFTSQISALLVTAAGSFLLVISGFEVVTGSMPPQAAVVSERLSAMSHFMSMARGVIDVRDVWYVITASALFLGLCYLWLLKHRLGGKAPGYRKFQTGMIIFIGVVVALNIYGFSGSWRLDLTDSKKFTLAPETKKILSSVPDDIKLTMYISGQLPAQLQPSLRDVKDLLSDYKSASGDKIAIEYVDPGKNEEAGMAASAEGIQPVQFNVVGQQELKVNTGYFGLVIQRGAEKEVIPFIEDPAGLEYVLSSNIRKLAIEDKKKIGVIGLSAGFQDELEKTFEVEALDVAEGEGIVNEEMVAVIVAGKQDAFSGDGGGELVKYVNNGGSVLVLAEGVQVNPQFNTVTAGEDADFSWLNEFGVSINQDLVYDVRSNELVNVGGGGPFGVAVQYPLWPRVQVREQGITAVRDIDGLVLPWASSLSINDEKVKEEGLSVKPFLLTSQFGGTMTENLSIDPMGTFAKENLGERVVGALVEGSEGKAMGRIAVVADSDFLSAQFEDGSGQAAALGSGLVSWLAKEESLAGVQARRQAQRNLTFENETQVAVVKYGNLGLAVVLPIGLWIYRWRRRKLLLVSSSK